MPQAPTITASTTDFLLNVSSAAAAGTDTFILQINGLSMNGVPLAVPGLNSSYGLYIEGTVALHGVPSIYDPGTISLMLDPTNNDGTPSAVWDAATQTGSVGFSNAANTADDITLATGDFITGAFGLQSNGHPGVHLVETFVPNPAIFGSLLSQLAGGLNIEEFLFNTATSRVTGPTAAGGSYITSNDGFGIVDLTAQSGTVDLTLNGSHPVLTLGDGMYFLTGDPGGGTVALGDGNQTVDLGGYGNHVTLGSGNDIVTFTGQEQTLLAGNGAETITLNGNFDRVTFGDTPAGATSTVSVDGIGETITGGSGNVAVTGSGGSAIVTLGDGSHTVALTGSRNSITVGSGPSVIDAGTNGAVVHTAGGNATITVGGESNLVDAGAGANVINAARSRLDTFMLNGSGQGLTTINGFAMGTGDVLDLTRTLAGVNIAPDLSNIGHYVTAGVSNGSTTLYVDPTGGAGTPYAFASLQGVATSVAALLGAHEFRVA